MGIIEEINKEQASAFSFPAGAVLMNQDLRKNRLKALHQAASVGNPEGVKVRIRLVTAEGPKEDFTTIWHHSDGHVVLNGSVFITGRPALPGHLVLSAALPGLIPVVRYQRISQQSRRILQFRLHR